MILRWEAYLRSRVRASQRLSSQSLSRPASIPSNMPGESNGKQQYFTLREKQPWSQSLHRIQHTGLSRSSSMNYGSTKDYPVGRRFVVLQLGKCQFYTPLSTFFFQKNLKF